MGRKAKLIGRYHLAQFGEEASAPPGDTWAAKDGGHTDGVFAWAGNSLLTLPVSSSNEGTFCAPALSEGSPELLGRIKCWDCAQELGEHASDDMGSKW